MKRQRRRVGDVVRIPLGGGRSSFGHVLPEPLVAVFDIVVDDGEAPEVAEIVKKPVLFRVWVMNHAITKGQWPVIGHVTPTVEELEPPVFWKRDPLDHRLMVTRDQGVTWLPTSREECRALECAAAWEPHHVVERIKDDQAGRPNVWVEMMQRDLRTA